MPVNSGTSLGFILTPENSSFAALHRFWSTDVLSSNVILKQNWHYTDHTYVVLALHELMQCGYSNFGLL